MLVFKSPEMADTSYVVYLNPEEASTVGFDLCMSVVSYQKDIFSTFEDDQSGISCSLFYSNGEQ